MFWLVVRAHHSDIGGATHGAYNPAATNIWHAGLRTPPMRLTENGVLREGPLGMLVLNDGGAGWGSLEACDPAAHVKDAAKRCRSSADRRGGRLRSVRQFVSLSRVSGKK